MKLFIGFINNRLLSSRRWLHRPKVRLYIESLLKFIPISHKLSQQQQQNIKFKSMTMIFPFGFWCSLNAHFQFPCLKHVIHGRLYLIGNDMLKAFWKMFLQQTLKKKNKSRELKHAFRNCWLPQILDISAKSCSSHSIEYISSNRNSNNRRTQNFIENRSKYIGIQRSVFVRGHVQILTVNRV